MDITPELDQKKEFPSKIRDMLMSFDENEIQNVIIESCVWGDTSMGFGGYAGQMMTSGWIVTIVYPKTIETWHVSAHTGGARLRRTEQR